MIFLLLSTTLSLTSPKVFEVQYYVTTSTANTDLGLPTGIDAEIYTYVKLTKLTSNLESWILSDSKSTGTVGGIATTGAWTTRDLNTVKIDGGINVTISSDQITFFGRNLYC